MICFFFSSRRRYTSWPRDWSSDVCSSDLVSFDPSTVVPGIDFTNDPVLQGRSFAYRDTDYHRLGTGNINEIPVNKPIAEVKDRKSTRLNSSHVAISYAVFFLKKKKLTHTR